MTSVSHESFSAMVASAIRYVQEQLTPYPVTILSHDDNVTWLPTWVVQEIKASSPAFGAKELCVIDISEGQRLLAALENGELKRELPRLLPVGIVLVE